MFTVVSDFCCSKMIIFSGPWSPKFCTGFLLFLPCFHRFLVENYETRELYSAANDPQTMQTGNDPQIGPQMIPNGKCPRCGPQMIPLENEEWHGVWFPGFFLFFILFSSLNDELDKHKEKIF